MITLEYRWSSYSGYRIVEGTRGSSVKFKGKKLVPWYEAPEDSPTINFRSEELAQKFIENYYKGELVSESPQEWSEKVAELYDAIDNVANDRSVQPLDIRSVLETAKSRIEDYLEVLQDEILPTVEVEEAGSWWYIHAPSFDKEFPKHWKRLEDGRVKTRHGTAKCRDIQRWFQKRGHTLVPRRTDGENSQGTT
jgi:hypothetical protein